MPERYYIYNAETERIELHFDKAEYDQAKHDTLGEQIRSTCLFSREAGAWVSRQKGRNPWRALQLAQKMGLEDRGETGERVSFAEKQEALQDRRERRADRYEGYSENAAARSEQLQAGLNQFRGDWAFATQPNVNSSGGRAFTRFRDRLRERYGRGIEEYRKSEYFQHRAANLRSLAQASELQSPAYLHRRLEENTKELEKYRARMTRLHERAEGDEWTEEDDRYMKVLEDAILECMEKIGYYQDALDALTAQGVRIYTRADVEVGDLVFYRGRWDRVWRVGPKNFQVQFQENCNWGIPYLYSEIRDLKKKGDE